MSEQNSDRLDQIIRRTGVGHVRGLRFEVVTVLAVTVLPVAIISATIMMAGQGGTVTTSNVVGAVLPNSVHNLVGTLLVAYVIYQRGDSLRRFGWHIRPAVFPGSLAVFVLAIAAYALVCMVLNSLGSLNVETPGARLEDEMVRQGGKGIFLLLVVTSPLFEQTVVRAYLMTRLRDLGFGWTWCILASTIVQTLYHVHKGIPLVLAYCASFLVFALCFARYRNLPVLILAHLYIDLVWWAIR